ncbi:MAG: efflux RND transporter periplasmic adaptor subunit [Candidatus Aminicenantes bacterium]|nr:efflux RND transporter periplasmic adaptor subunit [Candidatus Aminicenantes bacterium]
MKKVSIPIKRIYSYFLFVSLLSLLLLVSCQKGEKSASDPESIRNSAEVKDKVKEEFVRVKTAPVILDDLIIKLKSPGEAVTDKHIVLKPEVSGKIQNLYVEEGQRVKQGELLVKLDDREYALNLESADAARLKNLSELLLESQFSDQADVEQTVDREKLDEAEKEYENKRTLFRQGQVTEEDFQEASRQYELFLIESGVKKEEIIAAAKGLTQSEIDVKKARLNLEKTSIRAPFSGIITDVNVSPEEHVYASSELFTLVNIERIQVHAKVLESEIGKMKVGREVELRFSAYPDRIFKGEVKAISPVVNPEDKTCKVFIDALNSNEDIKPGMHAEVEIVADIYEKRLLVPQEAILHRGGRKLVFVHEDGLAKWRYVQTGLENEEYAEILPAERQGEGVLVGEQVLIEGHFTLAHDAHIRIEEK